MKIINVIEELSGYAEFREASVTGPMTKTSLEQLIDDAKKEGYNLVGLDVAEIHDEFMRGTYQSPVILFFDKENQRHAIISQKQSIVFGHLYTLHSYNP